MKSPAPTLLIVLLAAFACAPLVAGPLEPPAAERGALEAELRDAVAAEQRARSEYQERVKAGRLTRQERTDYEAYLRTLQARLEQLRAELDRLGHPRGTGTSGAMPGGLGGLWGRQSAPERTESEYTAALDAELDAALGDFDEMLLRKQAELSQRTAATADDAGGLDGGQDGGGGSGGGGGQGTVAGAMGEPMEGGGAPGSLAEALAGGAKAGAAGQQRAGELQDPGAYRPHGTPARGAGHGGAREGIDATPSTIPDGRDDDIVARQLREAAEKERDPALRERLWNEYRKYKGGG